MSARKRGSEEATDERGKRGSGCERSLGVRKVGRDVGRSGGRERENN